MSRRSIEWNKGLSGDLKNSQFAQAFIQASIEEGLSIQLILGKAIRAYGVKEFSAKVKLPSSNILRTVNPKHNATIDSLNRLLKPFNLMVTVGPAKRSLVA